MLVPSPRLHSRSWRNVHTQAPLPARAFLPVPGSILHATRIALLSVTPQPRAVILVRGAVCACGATMPLRHPTSRRKTRQAPLTHCEPPWRAQFPVLQWECVIGNGESARRACGVGSRAWPQPPRLRPARRFPQALSRQAQSPLPAASRPQAGWRFPQVAGGDRFPQPVAARSAATGCCCRPSPSTSCRGCPDGPR